MSSFFHSIGWAFVAFVFAFALWNIVFFTFCLTATGQKCLRKKELIALNQAADRAAFNAAIATAIAVFLLTLP